MYNYFDLQSVIFYKYTTNTITSSLYSKHYYSILTIMKNKITYQKTLQSTIV